MAQLQHPSRHVHAHNGLSHPPYHFQPRPAEDRPDSHFISPSLPYPSPPTLAGCSKGRPRQKRSPWRPRAGTHWQPSHLVPSDGDLRGGGGGGKALHAGPSLVNSSLSRQYHIVGQRIAVCSITRVCITCRRLTVRPQPQLMGQLPLERIAPGMVFENVGIDYAGPILLKLGRVRKPVIVKAYICVFVAVSVKAVHLEVVSDLTSEAFIACLRRFMARRGKPHTIWSDHGSNFVGASRELAELAAFLEEQRTQTDIPDFCASQSIRWSFIPERAPHFGGLWESAVKSMKLHLRRVVGSTRLTFEELTTALTQVEACLNSRPLVSLPSDGDGVEALTPGHFLIGRPLEALPDPPSACQSITVLRRWNLCQALTRHFWKRWSTDYFASLRRFSKWHVSSRNFQV